MDYKTLPLKVILRDRDVYNIFHSEFQKGTWLNLAGLQNSESSIEDLYRDDMLPKAVLDNIVARLTLLAS